MTPTDFFVPFVDVAEPAEELALGFRVTDLDSRSLPRSWPKGLATIDMTPPRKEQASGFRGYIAARPGSSRRRREGSVFARYDAASSRRR